MFQHPVNMLCVVYSIAGILLLLWGFLKHSWDMRATSSIEQQGSKIALVSSYLRVPQAAGQVKI